MSSLQPSILPVSADRYFQKLPAWLRRYLIALAILSAVVVLSAALLHTLGRGAVTFCVILLFIAMARAAWIGYGPGILVCLVIFYGVQNLLVPDRPHPVRPITVGFSLLILLVISRVSQNKRRTEAALRSTAESLQDRVMEGTAELSRKDARLREQGQLLDLAPVAILAADENYVIRIWSKGAETMYGWTAEEAVGKVSHELLRTVFPVNLPLIEDSLKARGIWEGTLSQTRRDGTPIRVISRWSIQRGPDGAAIGSLQVDADTTERQRIEQQLLQSQKMETAGLLAGGVAHDFNNLLTVINGYTEMILGDLPPDSPLRPDLGEIRAAGERAAGLTQQLLAFGRRQIIRPSVINLNDVVNDVERMLRRLIGEDIELVTRLDRSLSNVMADAGQIQQVIMNLAVNARDAMPGGGTLLFETGNASFDESFQMTHPEVQIGPAVLLAVSDTGCGMTAGLQERIFEPFFTTKEKGSGTGLGLSTVYGIVKQAGGWIWVYSEPGHGATFKIYLPAVNRTVDEHRVAETAKLEGSETILLVEDQAEVRKLAEAALVRYGYEVLSAGNGAEALSICREITKPIDLLLTDVVMPGMGGREIADRITAQYPNVQVLFMSGYTENVISHRGVLETGVAYLQKPFTPRALAEKVRETLAAKGNANQPRIERPGQMGHTSGGGA